MENGHITVNKKTNHKLYRLEENTNEKLEELENKFNDWKDANGNGEQGSCRSSCRSV